MLKIVSARMPHTLAEHSTQGEWKPYDYLRMMGRLIAQTVRNGGGNLIFNAPPGHGKSFFLARQVPTWYLENFPQNRVINAAHGHSLACDHGRYVRNTFAGNEYFTTKLRQDSKAADRWHTEEGGGMQCAGIGSNIMGWRGHLLLLDDPYGSWADAHSTTQRRTVLDWFINTFLSRREPGATTVVLMQRMHVEDLTGVLMKEQPDQWKQLSFPAIAEQDDPLGRQEGEPLCPDRFDVPALQAIRRSQIGGDFGWLAMYQQRPQSIGTGIAYRRFSPLHVEDDVVFDPRRPLQISFDFNIKPGMYAMCGQYNPLTDQFTVVKEIHGEGMDLIACMNALTPIITLHPWPEIHIFGDPTGGTVRNTQNSHYNFDLVLNHFKRIPDLRVVPTLKTTKAPPRVLDRVATVNDALADLGGVHHVRIHSKCEILTKDLSELRLDDDGQPDKADKTMTHASDAMGYWVHYQRPIGGPVIQTRSAFVIG